MDDIVFLPTLINLSSLYSLIPFVSCVLLSFVCIQEQYIFVHQCLLHWLSGRTSAWWEYRKTLPTSSNTQYSYSLKGMMAFLIRHLLFPCSPQTHRASSNVDIRMQDEPHSSSAQGNRARRRRRRHHRQTLPSDQPQSTVQQILHPGNLLRRLLPSSSLFKSNSHTSWAHIL